MIIVGWGPYSATVGFYIVNPILTPAVGFYVINVPEGY